MMTVSGRWAYAFPLLLGVLAGCRECGDQRAKALILAATEAHGGVEALRRLDNVALVCSGTFKQRLHFTRRLDARLPSQWVMEVRLPAGNSVRFGVNDGVCRRVEGFFVRECDFKEMSVITQVLNARFLHRLIEKPVRFGGMVEVEGRPYPSVIASDLQLVFDPDTHLLRQVRYGGDHVEAYSDEKDVFGARLASRRVLTIGGIVDIEETCEFLPGGADEQRLLLPPPNRDGDVVEGIDPPRLVAMKPVQGPRPEAGAIVKAAEANLGPHLSRSEGVILMPPMEPGGEWLAGVTLEPESKVTSDPSPFRIEKWPARRYVGVFFAGDHTMALTLWPRLSEVAEGRGLERVPGLRLEVIVPTEPEEGLSLLRVPVVTAE